MVTLVSTSELLVEFEMITITVVELSLDPESDPVVVVVSLVTFAVQLALKVEASMTLDAST